MFLAPNRSWFVATLVSFLFIPAWAKPSQNPQGRPSPGRSLASLSIEELANLEVTTATKDPEPISTTPAAIFVLTQDDIRRSGATTFADALRLVPGVEVGRVSSTTWAIGIRG